MLIPELLAPSGNRASLLAALSAGADAVYLGIQEFNARRNADNFKLEDLTETCDLVHLSGARLYLAMNTAVLPEELDSALQTARSAWLAGIDALIVQDLGFLATLRNELPELPIHVSTQMNLHSSLAVLKAAEFGAKRVTLARELSLEEIQKISETAVELEVFAHGALCVCYSGQCLFSSLIGRRSANRGLCAQACRLPYKLIDTSTGRAIKTEGRHLLSPRDLATLEILPDLIASGVSSLKIEGRMKSATYVYQVTKAYREALDALLLNKESDKKSALSDLAEVFSRGFSTAYLTGERGNAMMSYQRPNNRGVSVGRVQGISDGLVNIRLEKDLQANDVLEVRTNRGSVTVRVPEAANTGKLIISIPQPVGSGDRVFRVQNAALLDRDAGRFDDALFVGNNGLVGLHASVDLKLGQPARIRFESEPAACFAECTGAVVEPARSRSIDEAAVREHVGRIGQTPFSIKSWDIHLDEGVGLSFSELHRLRSEVLEQLTERMLEPWHGRQLAKSTGSRQARVAARQGKPELAVLVRDRQSAKLARKAGADLV
ncbi:MAG: U32 family peptidase, partial [Coriobacteriales bacterium]|nr:U32 family peptidase [Coriobacteriales bacterium]